MLGVGQLGRILQRDDVHVSREEVILEATFKCFNHSKEHVGVLALLLRDVDFQSISSDNWSRIGHFASSFGPGGDEMHRKVHESLPARRKRSRAENSDTFRPKRHCLQSWSPSLGASGRKVLLGRVCSSLRWREV
ncbi:unnamed protein product [Effrenium voratum]|nr:unnamed protein product [Effrenium voratum]